MLGKRYPNARVVGIDVSQHAIDIANKHLQQDKAANPSLLQNVSLELRQQPQLNEPGIAQLLFVVERIVH
jgi:hypothetical protein